MNLKRIFGTLLTILGVIGLIMAARGFMNNQDNWRDLIVYGVLGLIFFMTGIGLIKTTHDTAKM